MSIETLPDYAALQQLARALWHKGTGRGAAVLVGAGFSKFQDPAAHDTPEPPLWSELAREMAARLEYRCQAKIPSDPLRLAEEYRIYFGQAGLDEFIRIRICDSSWEPGSLHRELLGLQWSDVLTTNWDTLLERAADNISNRHYDRVLRATDLAHATSPRIVKLHGSIGTTEHFTVAEEDYRNYPVDHAAFVNMVRQVFIENDLCLLGFSGDDPNFLQWSKWVRDNLGGSARRIYLVGALNLSPAKRKFFEARNIAPIDFAPLVGTEAGSYRHKAATRLFLTFLRDAEPPSPHDWRPLSLPSQSKANLQSHAANLEQLAETWRIDRESYPGWLLCPASRRQQLLSGGAPFLITPAIVGSVHPEKQEAVVYEIFWRYKLALRQVDKQTAQLFVPYADPSTAIGPLKDKRCELALCLVRQARYELDEEAFERWAGIVKAHSEAGGDIRADLAYQTALFARDRLDFATAASIAREIEGPDPAWLLKRAGLLADLGEFEEAGLITNKALSELDRRQRTDRSSLWLRSRRAWAEWLARAGRQDGRTAATELKHTLEFRAAHCDPDAELEELRANASAILRQRSDSTKRTIPHFEAGHYHENSPNMRVLVKVSVGPREILQSLMEAVGLPMRLRHISLVGATARDAAEASFKPSLDWYLWFLRAVDSPTDPSFGRFLGRIAIAQLSAEVAATLAELIQQGISFWRKKAMDTNVHHHRLATDKLCLLVEALARLTIRREPSFARAILRLASDLALDITRSMSPGHEWLCEPLAHLVSYATEAIPPRERGALALRMLEFPLAGNFGYHSFEWPITVELLWEISPVRPTDDLAWTRCVNRLLELAQAESSQRREAIQRLAYLAKHNTLTDDESRRFARTLWSVTDPKLGDLPAGSDLLAPTFGLLPASEEINREERIRRYLFERDLKEVLEPPAECSDADIVAKLDHLRAIRAVTEGPFRPTAEQATHMFDIIVAWRPSASAPDLGERARHPLGYILHRVVRPAMPIEDLTLGRARALLLFLREVSGTTAAAVLPHFLRSGDTLRQEITSAVQQAISGRTDEEVLGGVIAVTDWAKLEASGAVKSLPMQLVDRLISAVEGRREVGMTAVIDGIGQLVLAGILNEDERSRMALVLGEVAAEKRYERIDIDSREAVNLSLVRAECVRLADALARVGTSSPHLNAWLDAAPNDPLPEVRFALEADRIVVY